MEYQVHSKLFVTKFDVPQDIKVNVAVYTELFLELASGHVIIVARVR